MRCDGDASTEEEELGPDDSLLCGCFDLKITEKEEFFGRKCPAHLCKLAHSHCIGLVIVFPFLHCDPTLFDPTPELQRWVGS